MPSSSACLLDALPLPFIQGCSHRWSHFNALFPTVIVRVECTISWNLSSYSPPPFFLSFLFFCFLFFTFLFVLVSSFLPPRGKCLGSWRRTRACSVSFRHLVKFANLKLIPKRSIEIKIVSVQKDIDTGISKIAGPEYIIPHGDLNENNMGSASVVFVLTIFQW